MQNSHKGNKTPKWDRILRLWTNEKSTQFVCIKITLSSSNHQSYNQQQVYWSELISRSDIHLYILSLSFRINTNESSNEQVFQEVRNFLQFCWVLNFVVELYCLHSSISLVRLHKKTPSFAFADVPSALVVFIDIELCCIEYFVLTRA